MMMMKRVRPSCKPNCLLHPINAVVGVPFQQQIIMHRPFWNEMMWAHRLSYGDRISSSSRNQGSLFASSGGMWKHGWRVQRAMLAENMYPYLSAAKFSAKGSYLYCYYYVISLSLSL